MLKNSELADISRAITLLTVIKMYLIDHDVADFIDKTGIDLVDIQNSIKALRHIHIKDTIRHKEHSNRANEWNKANPEKHRKHSRDYGQRKRTSKQLKGGE